MASANITTIEIIMAARRVSHIKSMAANGITYSAGHVAVYASVFSDIGMRRIGIIIFGILISSRPNKHIALRTMVGSESSCQFDTICDIGINILS